MHWPAKNISYEEMIFSEYAARNGIINTPPKALKSNLTLTGIALQVVRSHFKKPLVVSSGYRCSLLNSKVGGSERSHHILGLAADFTIPGIEIEDIIKVIPSLLNFDQCINEYGKWVHLSIHPNMRGQVFNIK